MFQTADNFTINVREKCKKMKTFFCILSFIAIIMGIIYILYYGMMSNDDGTILGYTQDIFKPIASYFYPNENDLIIYKKTSIDLFKLVIPFVVFYIIIDTAERIILTVHNSIKINIKK